MEYWLSKLARSHLSNLMAREKSQCCACPTSNWGSTEPVAICAWLFSQRDRVLCFWTWAEGMTSGSYEALEIVRKIESKEQQRCELANLAREMKN